MFAFWLVALAVTLGVAVVGWFRPLPPKAAAKPTYSSQQVADAKVAVCAAYEKVHSAIGVTMGRDGGNDSTSQLAVATSARKLCSREAYTFKPRFLNSLRPHRILRQPFESWQIYSSNTQLIISMDVRMQTWNHRCETAMRQHPQ